MTVDIVQAVDLLKETLLRDLGDEVDLIFRYGSHLKGAAHQYSDIDISYVPTHETTWHSITVMVDNTMIDLYPIHWSKLDQMAYFDDISCTVLLKNEIVYQRNAEVGERFKALPLHLNELRQPYSRAVMLCKARAIFQATGYQYYLLRQQAAAGHLLSCMQHGQSILKQVLHCLMVCNQDPIDTRKLDKVLRLPKLPVGFAETVNQITYATTVDEIVDGCEILLRTTRELLLNEQKLQRNETTFPAVFGAAYPELKGDIQHLMLACERKDLFNTTLISLYHELMIHTAKALTGVEYSGFNSVKEYEQDLTAMGFPDLLTPMLAGNFDELHQQCHVFDQRLRQYLTEHEVALNDFATLDDLAVFLESDRT